MHLSIHSQLFQIAQDGPKDLSILDKKFIIKHLSSKSAQIYMRLIYEISNSKIANTLSYKI